MLRSIIKLSTKQSLSVSIISESGVWRDTRGAACWGEAVHATGSWVARWNSTWAHIVILAKPETSTNLLNNSLFEAFSDPGMSEMETKRFRQVLRAILMMPISARGLHARQNSSFFVISVHWALYFTASITSEGPWAQCANSSNSIFEYDDTLNNQSDFLLSFPLRWARGDKEEERSNAQHQMAGILTECRSSLSLEHEDFV